jgi:hypothetical protein
MYLKETEREEVHNFKLAQVRVHLQALENTVTVQETSRNFLTNPETKQEIDVKEISTPQSSFQRFLSLRNDAFLPALHVGANNMTTFPQ